MIIMMILPMMIITLSLLPHTNTPLHILCVPAQARHASLFYVRPGQARRQSGGGGGGGGAPPRAAAGVRSVASSRGLPS